MFLIACFVLGVANFAMHKAVMESGHPFVEDTKLYFGRHFGRNGSYMVEYILLLGRIVFRPCQFRPHIRAICRIHAV